MTKKSLWPLPRKYRHGPDKPRTAGALVTLSCSICKKPFAGFGNNASPISDGRCCDWCNSTVVLPARMLRLYTS